MKTPFSLLRLALLLSCILSFSAADAFAEGPPRNTVRVTADRLNVRSGPGPRFKIVTSVPHGALLKVVDARNGWIQVRRPSGVLGWVSSAHTVRVR